MFKDVAKRNALLLLVAVNLFYFSTYVLGWFPLLVLANVAIIAICVGGALNLLVGNKCECDDDESTEFIKAERIASVLQIAQTVVNKVCIQASKIVLWKDPAQSCYTLIGLYVVRVFLRILPLSGLLFMGVWAYSGWVCFNEQYYALIYPRIQPTYEKVTGFAVNFYSSIPRFKDTQKL